MQAAFAVVILVSSSAPALGFSSFGTIQKLQVEKDSTRKFEPKEPIKLVGVLRTSAMAVLASVFLSANPVYADEFGRETEAPTLFTGETVMVRILGDGVSTVFLRS